MTGDGVLDPLPPWSDPRPSSLASARFPV